MTDLADIGVMAFGGSGIWCLVVAALASLLVTTRLRPGRVTVLAFLLCWIWPFIGLASDFDRRIAMEAFGHALGALPGDAVWLIARFAGMYAVIALLWHARLALHGRRPVTSAAPRGA